MTSQLIRQVDGRFQPFTHMPSVCFVCVSFSVCGIVLLVCFVSLVDVIDGRCRIRPSVYVFVKGISSFYRPPRTRLKKGGTNEHVGVGR